jgi:hypothetical protein
LNRRKHPIQGNKQVSIGNTEGLTASGSWGVLPSKLNIDTKTYESKICLYEPNSSTDIFGMGVTANQFNMHVPTASDSYVWHATGKNGGSTGQLMRLSGEGRLSLLLPSTFTTLTNTGAISGCSVSKNYPIVVYAQTGTANSTRSAIAFQDSTNTNDKPGADITYVRTSATGSADVGKSKSFSVIPCHCSARLSAKSPTLS